MYRQTKGNKQLWAWTALAMSAPLAHFSGGSWLGLLVLGLLCFGVMNLFGGVNVSSDNRLLRILELLWLVVLLSQLIPMSASYWPGEMSKVIVPAVLLALSAYGCTKAPSRTAGVLFWLMILLYVPLIVAGIRDVSPAWLIPDNMDVSPWLIPILLLPSMSEGIKYSKGSWWYLGILLFGLVLWVITGGVLSPQGAKMEAAPFYQLSRSLTIGSTGRFESLIAVGVMFGWYGFGSLLIDRASNCAKALGVDRNFSAWAVAAASFVLMFLEVDLPDWITITSGLAVWIILPMLCYKINSKKEEKGY